MSWPIRMVTEPATTEQQLAVRVGDMWYDDRQTPDYLAAIRHHDHAGKRPLIVVLPGPVHFAVYGPASTTGTPWQVSGDPPNLTIVPSINVHGVYHGFIQAGVITDDCEGRKFNEAGRRAQG